MTQMEVVYGYLMENYGLNEPIFLVELKIPGVKTGSLRQQIMKLTEEGRLKRFDTGIYYLPKKPVEGHLSEESVSLGAEENSSDSQNELSIEEVIRRKYCYEQREQCGYFGGVQLAKELGLTARESSVYEVYTNKATTDYRDTMIGEVHVILRRPSVNITSGNVRILQFLDLLKDVVDVSDVDDLALKERLVAYMKTYDLTFRSLNRYLPYYPDRVYKNMYQAGLLNPMNDIRGMSDDQIDAELEKGYEDMKSGRTKPARAVFDKIREDYNI